MESSRSQPGGRQPEVHRGCEFIMGQSRKLGRSGLCAEEEGWVLTPVLAREALW